jgi:hypothetical protein
MRHVRWLLVVLVFGCGNKSPGVPDAAIDSGYSSDACDDLWCFQVNCADKGLPPTRITGTVHAPNGSLPLYGVDVYIPRSDPGPLPEGVQCAPCSVGLPGGAYVQTRTDEEGKFTLENVPATSDVPLVVQIGKWRRQITIPKVAACQTLELSAQDIRLPKDRTEGDLPQIAISTGAADALECLAYKLGIAPSEFTTEAGSGRVHMFANTGINPPTNMPPAVGRGTDRFNATHPGGANEVFTDSRQLWATTTSLSRYDIVLLSCEGNQAADTKPLTSMQALKDYADAGGRIFMSHWHNIWIGGRSGMPSQGIPEWQSVATWNYGASQTENTQLSIVDETVPKGMPFATWLVNVGASTVRGEIPITEPRYTAQAHDPTKSERWVYVDPTRSTPLGRVSVQDLLFTTPQTFPPEERCGKVVFSDMHVSSGSVSGSGTTYNYPFPNGCSNTPLSPQEKALAFIFFDISSCVGTIF